MKRIKASALLVLSCILVVISFSACSNEDIPTKAPSSGSIYPLTDVHVMASGFVSTKYNKNSLNETKEFKAEDFVITPISEEEAKSLASKANGLNTGEAGDDGSTLGIYNWVTLLYRC